jgi:hypothetical protein
MEGDFARFKDAVLTVAKNDLDRLGALSPFAIVLRSDADAVSFIEAEQVSEQPQRDLNALEGWLRRQIGTGMYRAAGVCGPCEVTVGDGPATVRALFAYLESRSGEAVNVYVPFEKHDTYEYQEEVVIERTPEYFTPQGTQPSAAPAPGTLGQPK